jgi:hypothetical protein
MTRDFANSLRFSASARRFQPDAVLNVEEEGHKSAKAHARHQISLSFPPSLEPPIVLQP